MLELFFEDLSGPLACFDGETEEIVIDLDHIWYSSCYEMDEFIKNFSHTLAHELMHWFIWQEGLAIPYGEPRLRENQEYDFMCVWHLSPEEEIIVEVTK